MATKLLDPDSPVPLFHQLAEILRYRIATGALPAGAVLPPLRRAAEEWGVNLHTVRHAYAELAKQGLTETVPPKGTVVLASRGGDERAAFLASVIRQASERFAMSVAELQRGLADASRLHAERTDRVFVVECSEMQAAELARQLAARWRIDAEPWSLERPGEPPAGTVVATYFHYNDIRGRWPERFPDVRFLASHPAAEIVERLTRFRRGRGALEVIVCERDALMAQNIAADLRRVLPPERFSIRPLISASPGNALRTTRGTQPILFAPRVWANLTPAQRANPRALQVTYVFDSRDLAALGADLAWQPNAEVLPLRRAAI